jgi:NTE family protein
VGDRGPGEDGDRADLRDVPAPVEWIPGDERSALEDTLALCLSGGGYRAMLFHLGALWRLNEAAYLPRLDRVSSVSGGSIAAGLLGWRWGRLTFDGDGRATNFAEEVAGPLRRLARHRIDVPAVPGSIAGRAAGHYRRHLFRDPANPTGRPTLQALPERPRFVVNATNLQSGALWRFSKPYMADYRVGMVRDPDVELAVVVAASAAFPPFLSPLRLEVPLDRYEPPSGDARTDPDLTSDDHRRRVRLSDGGVYDNLGLETAFKRCRRLLVSDGGGKMGPAAGVPRDWLRQMIRIGDAVDNQVRSLRKRSLIESFRSEDPLIGRDGAYWSLRSDPSDYPVPDPLLPPPEQIARARGVKTRLAPLDEPTQESLVNWGYAACDLGLRGYVEPALARPAALPHPAAGPA